MHPHISVIVPVYNVAPYMVRCLESIRRQDYKDIEVILVDDCGTDNSIRIAQEYLAAHPMPDCRIVAHTANRGLSAARNTGLDAASGEYVYFLDSDDEMLPGCLHSLAAVLDEASYDFIVGSYEEREEGKTGGQAVPNGLGECVYTNPLKAYAEGRWYVMAWNKLCRRAFLLENGLRFEEGMLHEDVPWSFQVACKARTVRTIGQATYAYYVRAASIMTSLTVERDVEVYLQAFGVISRYIKANGLERERYAYLMTEGKKSGILYSLLQKGERRLYRRFYPRFHALRPLSPWEAYRRKMISLPYLLRDFHYCLPLALGSIYKHAFYLLYYKARGREIEGAVW